MRLFVAALAFACLSCGGSAIRDTARATTLAGGVLSSARGLMVSERREELDSCSNEQCLDDVAASWSGPLESYEAARLAHSALVDALVVAQIAEQDGASRHALQAALDALANAAMRIVTSLEASGHPLPVELVQAINVIVSVLNSLSMVTNA